jgi:preprotein translocase subunit SecG
MTILFIILIILASVILGLIVLVQNPKGGGLAGNIAGFSNQFMGVKQTTDILEKGTWLFAAIVGALCLVSSIFISGSISSSESSDATRGTVPASQGVDPGAGTPNNTTTMPGTNPTPNPR